MIIGVRELPDAPKTTIFMPEMGDSTAAAC
jgi:hypothetical protein